MLFRQQFRRDLRAGRFTMDFAQSAIAPFDASAARRRIIGPDPFRHQHARQRAALTFAEGESRSTGRSRHCDHRRRRNACGQTKRNALEGGAETLSTKAHRFSFCFAMKSTAASQGPRIRRLKSSGGNRSSYTLLQCADIIRVRSWQLEREKSFDADARAPTPTLAMLALVGFCSQANAQTHAPIGPPAQRGCRRLKTDEARPTSDRCEDVHCSSMAWGVMVQIRDDHRELCDISIRSLSEFEKYHREAVSARDTSAQAARSAISTRNHSNVETLRRSGHSTDHVRIRVIRDQIGLSAPCPVSSS